MRLIDADALKEHLGSGWVNSEFAIRQVDNEITIEAVEVVRCRECRHSDPSTIERCWCSHHAMYMSADGYCSEGERPEAGNDA